MPRAVAIVVAVLLGLGAAVPAAAVQATAVPPAAPHRPLTWDRCGSAQCATLAVPVDPAQPELGTVDLALARLPARDTTRRIGTLVVDFGGPGDPGSRTLQAAAGRIPAGVRDRFDVVAFDPRGAGSSRPLDCIDDATTDRVLAEDPTPASPADLPRYYDGSASSVDLVGACLARFGPWTAEVGTRAVADDLDRIRAALGERRISYLGFSYGAVLGAAYAQRYRARVRALLLDSPVDLSATPDGERRSVARGIEGAFRTFLDDCARNPACALHGDGRPQATFERLRDELEAGRTIPTADGRAAGPTTLYLGVIVALYQRAAWPVLALALRAAAAGDATGLQQLADAYAGRDAGGRYDSMQEAIGFIRCADRPEPREPYASFAAAYEGLSRELPLLGPFLASSPVGCDPRLLGAAIPGEALGDVSMRHAPPTLIVATTHDPITAYRGALDLRRRLPGARVLRVEDTQHTGVGLGVACIDDAATRLLVDRRLPARRTRCRA